MRGLNRVAVFLGVIAAISWAMVVFSVAQTETLPPETPSHQTVPEATGPGKSGSSTGPLSDKLDRSGGVIHPPSGIDPAIAQPPPAEGRTPVIPPPGTPGGKPGTEPK